MASTTKLTGIADQEQPIMRVVGRIAAGDEENDGSGVKYLLHCGWSRKTFQVSNRGLKVIRGLDITILDEPDDYNI